MRRERNKSVLKTQLSKSDYLNKLRAATNRLIIWAKRTGVYNNDKIHEVLIVKYALSIGIPKEKLGNRKDWLLYRYMGEEDKFLSHKVNIEQSLVEHFDPKEVPEMILTEYGKNRFQSVAENRVSDALNSIGVNYNTEVSFSNLKNNTGQLLLFDFYIPSLKMMIEYDGKDYHKSKKSKLYDAVKNVFCKVYGYHLIRLNCKHWAELEDIVIKKVTLRIKKTKATNDKTRTKEVDIAP